MSLCSQGIHFVNGYMLVRALFIAYLMSILIPGLGEATAVGVALPSLAPVIKATSPAVVNIATRGTLTEPVAGNPLRLRNLSGYAADYSVK